MRKSTLLSVLFMCSIFIGSAQTTNSTCAGMLPICTHQDSTNVFPINANAGSAPAGNNYGCVGTQNNPSWFYFKIGTNGDINMNLTSTGDMDFIIWGPFADLTAAQSQCGNLGNGTPANIADCGYIGGNTELPDITGAIVGEVYVMMVTNFSNLNTTFTINQIGGLGSTDCSIVVPPCYSQPGTFNIIKNGLPATSPLSLCGDDNYAILSNGDYGLPEDTIAVVDGGDGIFSAQLMFLVYDAVPNGGDPATDPGYTGVIIPSDTIFDVNNSTSLLMDSLGINCGTIYLVPVAGDDGIGGFANMQGPNDNGSLHYDLDGNGCYVLGTPIEIKYACPIVSNSSINCVNINNSILVDISGGDGDVVIFNQGAGILSEDTISTPDNVILTDLTNNSTYELILVDAIGCTDTVTGDFYTPQMQSVDVFAASGCNAEGYVLVSGVANSGNGGITNTFMNGVPGTTPPNDSLSSGAGTIVNIILADAFGCTWDTAVTIPAITHTIDITHELISGVSCYNGSDAVVRIIAKGIDGSTGVPDGIPIVGILWTAPNGAQFPGLASNDTLINMMPGQWVVTVTDQNTCVVSYSFNISNPSPLAINPGVLNPQCYQGSTGALTPFVNGGTQPLTYEITDGAGTVLNAPGTSVANQLVAGTYTIKVTDGNGCVSSINQALVDPEAIGVSANIKHVNCYGAASGLIAVTPYNNQGNVTYSWTIPGQPSFSSDSIVSELEAGNYTLTIVDAMGCSNSFDYTITENDSIGTTIGKNASYCRTKSFQSGNGSVFATANGGGSGSFSFEWTNDKNNDTHNGSQWNGLAPAFYAVEITDGLGCMVNNSILLDSISPNASFTAVSDEFLSATEYEGTDPVKVKFTNTSTGYAQEGNPLSDTIFQWNLYTNNELDNNWFFTYDISDKPDTTYTEEEVYQVCLVAKNYNDCVDTTCLDIVVHSAPVLEVPNVFTPGAFPNNEFFFPNVGIDVFECGIMNRYGVEVFRFTDINDKWNGNLDNGDKACSDGVYFYTYKAIATNKKEFEGSGTVTLIRSKK
ncbi:hypothetical protein DNU06_00535 [Putridiphycobacter roseus]|uniref:Ig-like domain-containing protein n=1 Tax=Putridiphycobacter roseus TaxID=2219161 RepID=A0A2W1NFT8_9FLAO|nr:gliding motility-associated C-terminal domain-containing protein [Putridiphycobacter roseus]PZE18355.1 hypothetical protein DNU06_00535 [Putridiphycobacter roseus]